MSLFKPTYHARKVTEISGEFLTKNNFRGIILDIDDTLVPHRHPDPDKNVFEWIDELKKFGIKIILVSNNFKDRVNKFAEKLNLPYISMGLKPLPFGIKRAVKKLGMKLDEILIIGDQIFTDISGANILKIKSVLVDPVSPSKTVLLKIKRFLERPIRKKLNLKYDSFN